MLLRLRSAHSVKRIILYHRLDWEVRFCCVFLRVPHGQVDFQSDLFSARRPHRLQTSSLLFAAFRLSGPLLICAPATPAAIESDDTQPGKSNDGYVGSQARSQSIWISIGDSSRPARDGRRPQSRPRFLARTPTSASHFNEPLDWHFEVYSQDGKLYQSEFETDAGGKENFRVAHPIELIIGAGVKGFGGIIRLGNLFVSGAAVVRFQNRSWGPSPGYEVVDFGFNRPITAGCIFCLADVRGR
jgi:hypothetical protein